MIIEVNRCTTSLLVIVKKYGTFHAKFVHFIYFDAQSYMMKFQREISCYRKLGQFMSPT